MYGWRGRIGRLTPSAAVNGEQEWARALPDGFIVVSARMYIEEVTADNLEAMMAQVERSAKEIASARVDVIMQCGTPGVALKGADYGRKITEMLQKTSGRPVGTMAMAVVEALKRLGAKKVAVGTPYIDDVTRGVVRFLEDNGFEVRAVRNLGILRNHDIGELAPHVSYRLGRRVADEAPDADAIFISCGNFRTFDIIEALEEDTGRPVVSSNQAALWKALRLIGYNGDIPGLGKLFELGATPQA